MAELHRGIVDTFNRLKRDKKALFTVVAGISGMLLVLISEIPAFSDETKNDSIETAYISQSLEEDTERLISQINGAGKVSVMLTYEASEETIWAKDKDSETDPEGENNVSEKYIIIDSDGGETGLAVKVIYPRVRGVAVVCTGGDNPVVKSEIKSLLSALFDIGSNRISIAPRAVKE